MNLGPGAPGGGGRRRSSAGRSRAAGEEGAAGAALAMSASGRDVLQKLQEEMALARASVQDVYVYSACTPVRMRVITAVHLTTPGVAGGHG